MIERYIHNKITWLDVVSPTQEELYEILNECSIPRELGNDLKTTNAKGEVFASKGILKLTLTFPIVKRTDINHPHEVKFIITKNHLITIRFEDIGVIHEFSKEFEVLTMLEGKKKMPTDRLLIVLLNKFYESLHTKLDYLTTKLTDIEDEIFKEHEREMVSELSHVSRRIISFRHSLSSHLGVLSKLENAMYVAFAKKHSNSLDALIHHYETITGRLDSIFSTFDNLRDTNNSLLTTKQNEIMKFLTVISFITFPLMLLTSMFGMNTIATPLIGIQHDFWIILGVMAFFSILLLLFFKIKRWL